MCLKMEMNQQNYLFFRNFQVIAILMQWSEQKFSSIWFSFKISKPLFEILMQEKKPVRTDNTEFEIRDYSVLLALIGNSG